MLNLLNLYKMIITFVMLISGEKRHSLCDIDQVSYIKLYKYKKHAETFLPSTVWNGLNFEF